MFPYAQLYCPGYTPSSPVIRLSKDVAAHDWVIDVKCSSNIKFVWNGQRKALFTVKILSKVPISPVLFLNYICMNFKMVF